jgi:alpha-ketoglutarate-dependent taurine dioxygenase
MKEMDLRVLKRKAIPVSQKAWVRTEWLQGEDGPLIVRPAVSGLDLSSWAGGHREFIEGKLSQHGAMLFRGFGIDSAEAFERFVKAASSEPLEYRERSSPRQQVRGNIYTSTDYPADQSIFFHNENSYQRVWPMKLFFFCLTPAEAGGETPIADSRKVLKRLSQNTRDRFDEKQCLYVRNFDDVLGLPWQTVFQTTDRSEVEESCR